VLEWLNRTDC